MNLKTRSGLMIALIACVESAAIAQYEINWSTIDGGGAMVSSGGAFTLGGTIGQPDASSPAAAMSGGAFELVGGFWTVATICRCPGDMNGDGRKDGLDVQQFLLCVTSNGVACSCADVNGMNGVDLADVDSFVANLLAQTPCL